MASKIPLLIRLQLWCSRLREKVTDRQYTLRIIDWLDKRRGLRKVRLDRHFQSAADLPSSRFRRTAGWMRRHWILCSLLCLLPAGAALLPSFRQWRCDRLLGSAERSLAQHEWKPAFDTARAVLQIRPGDRRAQWVVFRARRETHPALAVGSALRLCSQEAPNDDEAFELLQFLAGDQPQGAFLAAFATLTPERREEPRFRTLYAQLQMRRGNAAAAAGILESIPGSVADPAVMLQRVRVSCASGTAREIQKARALFLALRAAGAPEALPALRSLAAVPAGVHSSVKENFPILSAWLESLPEAGIADHLIAFDQRWDEGAPVEKLIAEATGRFAEAHLPEVCAWLNRHGRRAEVIMLTSGRENTEPSGFAALVEAQLALGLPAGLLHLDHPPAFADPVDLALLRVRACVAGWINSGENAAWQRALEAVKTSRKSQHLREFVRLCREANRPAEMQDALAFAWQQPGGNLPVFADTIPVLEGLARRDKLPEVIRILTNLRRFESSNPLLNTRLLYFQCLAGQASAAAARPVLTSFHSGSPGHRSAEMLALVLVLDGRTADAAGLLQSLPPSPLAAAIHGTALKLNGRTDEATALCSQIKWNSGTMLPAEERTLLSLLQSPPAAGTPHGPAGS